MENVILENKLLKEENQKLKNEVKKYEDLWKRECEAYKDLAIKMGI